MSQTTSRAAEPQTVYAMQVETGKPVSTGPGQSTLEELGLTTGKWEDQLCGCFSSLVPNCLMVSFCPCVSLAQIAHRLDVAPYMTVLLISAGVIALEWVMFFLAVEDQASLSSAYYGDDDYYYYYAHRVYSYRSANVAYRVVSLAVEVAVIAFVWHLRRTTRARFEIPGSACEDCLVSFFCSCCSMAQVATHIKSYKPGNCDFGAPDTLPAFPLVNAA